MNLEINHIIKAKTMITMIMPAHTPALKIVPITSQLVSKEMNVPIKVINPILFIIDNTFYVRTMK